MEDPRFFLQRKRKTLQKSVSEHHDDTIGSGDLYMPAHSSGVLAVPYSSILPEFKHWQSGHNVASLLCPPIGVYRILKWRKHVTIYSNEVVPYAEVKKTDGLIK